MTDSSVSHLSLSKYVVCKKLPYVELTKSGNQTITSGAFSKVIELDNLIFDTDGLVENLGTSDVGIRIKNGGTYTISTFLCYSPDAAAGIRNSSISLTKSYSGAQFSPLITNTQYTQNQILTFPLNLTKRFESGDFIQFRTFQGTGIDQVIDQSATNCGIFMNVQGLKLDI